MTIGHARLSEELPEERFAKSVKKIRKILATNSKSRHKTSPAAAVRPTLAPPRLMRVRHHRAHQVIHRRRPWRRYARRTRLRAVFAPFDPGVPCHPLHCPQFIPPGLSPQVPLRGPARLGQAGLGGQVRGGSSTLNRRNPTQLQAIAATSSRSPGSGRSDPAGFRTRSEKAPKKARIEKIRLTPWGPGTKSSAPSRGPRPLLGP
jgi:hypothetical protein